MSHYRLEVRLLKVQPQEAGETFLSEQEYFSVDTDEPFASESFTDLKKKLEDIQNN